MKHYFIDTNLIVRFITGKPEDQAEATARFLEKSDSGKIIVHITPLTVAEVVFVLTGKVYNYPKEAVANALNEFLSNPSFIVQDLECLQEALRLFSEHNVDFADTCLAVSAKRAGATVASFDKDFKKTSGN